MDVGRARALSLSLTDFLGGKAPSTNGQFMQRLRSPENFSQLTLSKPCPLATIGSKGRLHTLVCITLYIAD